MIFLSGKPKPSTPLLDKEKFRNSLENHSNLVDLVKRLMGIEETEASKLLEKVTKTGYRRVHDYVALALDRSIEICKRTTSAKLSNEEVNEIILLLSRGLILINYQLARKQLNENIAICLRGVLEHILDKIQNGVDKSTLTKMIESARTLVDALAVVVYRYAEKKVRESTSKG